jgi:hypothetical protein
VTCSADKLACMCISGCWSIVDDDVTVVAVGVTVIGNVGDVVAVAVAVVVVRVGMLG